MMSKVVLKSNIDKACIADMEMAQFEGRVIVVQSVGEAEKAMAYLATCPLVGIDTETRPAFAKGQHNMVALLQVSTDDTCFLFRLNMIGFPPCMKSFFESETTVKVGLSLKDDFDRLHKKGKFEQKNYVELQEYVAHMGIEAQSLQKIYALLFGRRISKSQRLTNWEADVLTDAQKVYAATDAWACVKMYRRLEEITAGEYTIDTETKEGQSEQ